MTYNEIKKYIEENGIKKRVELCKESRKVYDNYKKLSKKEQDELLPSLIVHNYSNLNTISDFRGFIQENNIVSRDDFRRRFSKGYRKFLKILTKEEQEKILPSIVRKYSNLNTMGAFEKFIQENNIASRDDFNRRFSKGYRKFLKILTKEEQGKILPSNHNDYSDLDTISDFRGFIQENNIASRDDFNRRFYRGYVRFLKILSEEEQDELLPSNFNDYSDLNTINDFRGFIQENNIVSRDDFNRRFRGGYKRFLKSFTKEEQEELLPLIRNDYSDLNTINDFEKFIQENNIVSRDDFNRRFSKGYVRFLKILSEGEQEKLLPPVKSFGEISLRKLFDDNLINYVSEKTFEDLKGKKKRNLRYDFYLPDYNILIEYHGSQHFDPDDNFYTEDAILRDKVKFEYAKLNNISILYFTNEVGVYEKHGYFTEVITDSDILIQKIKEISLTN